MPTNLDLLPIPFVRYQDENGKPSQLKFRRLWWQLLAWFFSQLQWSDHTSGSDLAERRKRTSTWVELAIACHLLTSGAAAPNGASLLQAASVMRSAFYHFYRIHGLQVNGKLQHHLEFFRRMPIPPALDNFGLPRQSGLARRPLMQCKLA